MDSSISEVVSEFAGSAVLADVRIGLWRLQDAFWQHKNVIALSDRLSMGQKSRRQNKGWFSIGVTVDGK